MSYTHQAREQQREERGGVPSMRAMRRRLKRRGAPATGYEAQQQALSPRGAPELGLLPTAKLGPKPGDALPGPSAPTKDEASADEIDPMATEDANRTGFKNPAFRTNPIFGMVRDSEILIAGGNGSHIASIQSVLIGAGYPLRHGADGFWGGFT